jgi:DNA polymerase III alpha subunit
MKIKRIISKKTEPVYDIEMPSFHNFVLENGVVAHNCSHAVSYAYITYACMFLKYFYPLEWWSSILSNASESEVSGKFWPHVKHLIAPPDVNISGDTMTVDYDKKMIRSKLGVIRGMGDASVEPIVNNRPYDSIQDFVNKDVCGPSLAHKLIHVGFFDSIFKPHMSLEEKLKAYQDAVEIKKYNDKKAKAEKEGKKVRLTQPKSGSIPEQYVNLHPLKSAAMQKSTLPTLPLDLQSLGAKYSKIRDPEATKPKVLDLVWNKSIFLVDGPTIDRLDALALDENEKDIYVAATCYVIECKEFSYSKSTKRALKLILDCGSGSISEKVLWPNYTSGSLEYPKELKKGCLATIIFRKRAGKGLGMNITSITVETT